MRIPATRVSIFSRTVSQESGATYLITVMSVRLWIATDPAPLPPERSKFGLLHFFAFIRAIRKSWSKPNLSTPEWRMATKIAKICHFEKKIVSFSKFQNQTTSQFLARISSKLYLILTSLFPSFCHFIYLSRHLSVTCPPPHLIKLSITQYHSTYFLVLFSITWYYLTDILSFV